MKKLYDISEVCSMLGTTSRTLRFYEEQCLIQSTVMPPSQRRKYTQEQLNTVKTILALRALGLPIKAIKDLSREKTTLKDAILLHRAELIRVIVESQARINLLEEVLHNAESDGADVPDTRVTCTEEQMNIAQMCTDAVIDCNLNVLTDRFSDDLKTMLPEKALAHSLKMTTDPIGDFIRKGIPARDEKLPNIIICPLKYEKMTLRLKYVFHGDVICGFWTDYAE